MNYLLILMGLLALFQLLTYNAPLTPCVLKKTKSQLHRGNKRLVSFLYRQMMVLLRKYSPGLVNIQVNINN